MSEAAFSPATATPDGIRLHVRVQPKARSNGIKGVAAEADGTAVLKVAVTAAPEDGKANDAVAKLLAKACGVAARDVSVVAGAAARRKVIRIAGDPCRLMDDLRRIAAAAMTGATGD